MFINRQRKQTLSQRLNHTQILETTISDQLADSNITKRFNRTRNSIEQNSKKPKLSKGLDCSLLGNKKLSLSIQNYGKQSKYIFKPDELFLKISETPFKDRTHLQATSDRTTESTYLAQANQSEQLYLCSQFQLKQQDCSSLKQQLELKNTEIKSLQFTLQSINKNMKLKEDEYTNKAKQKEAQYKMEANTLRDQIKELKMDLQEKNATIKEMKKNEVQLNRDIKSAKYHKGILEKQYQDLCKKKIPKDIKDLITYRELSLQAYIQQLNNALQQSKTDIECNLEQQITRLKEQNHKAIVKIKHMELQVNTLNKKLFDSQSSLKQKTENFNKWYYQMKENQTLLLAQLKQARKQNIKLLRMRIHKPKCDNSFTEQSLTLSLQENV